MLEKLLLVATITFTFSLFAQMSWSFRKHSAISGQRSAVSMYCTGREEETTRIHQYPKEC